MHVIATPIAELYAITIVTREDSRGFFGRTWDAVIAKEHGLQQRFDYTCISRNNAKHTLRGMHEQQNPHGEVKLVRCTKGAIFDVVIDLRSDSKTFKQWFGAELNAENHQALYIPTGCAHGFLSLTDESEVLYQIAGDYVAEAGRGVRWNDPTFGIQWPALPKVLSDRDATYPDFSW